jgi:Ca2+-binding EF-hand superfamily protein
LSKKDVNQIFEIIDENKSGGVTLKELQSFFHGGVNDEFRMRIENLKWAGYIFTEMNKKMVKVNKSLKEMLEIKEASGEVEVSRLRRLMLELNVATYNEDSKAKSRLDADLAVKKKQGIIDYFLLQSCLTTYINEQSEGNREDSLHLTFLGRFNFKVDKIVDYLDIEADEIITKSEFTFGVKRLLPAFSEDEIKEAFDKIVGSENVGKLPVKRLRIFYQKYLDLISSSSAPIDLAKSSALLRPANSDNFLEFANKIARFFSYDSFRFYADLKTFDQDGTGFIKFSHMSIYLRSLGLLLSQKKKLFS